MFTPQPSSLSIFSRQFLVALGVYSFSLSVGAQLLPPPSIPAGVPNAVTLSIDEKDSAHKPDQDSPTELRDWYGEKESTLQKRYVEYKAKNYEADVFAGWSNDAGVTVTNNRLLIDTEAEIGSAYGGYLLNTGTVSVSVKISFRYL